MDILYWFPLRPMLTILGISLGIKLVNWIESLAFTKEDFDFEIKF